MLGLAYPLVMTGIAQVAFPGKADGSLVNAGRQGRRLAAHRPASVSCSTPARRTPTATPITGPIPSTSSRGRRRPATAPTATYFANRGPNSAVGARTSTATRSPPTWRSSGRYDPGLTKAKVPVDAVDHVGLRASTRTSRRPTPRIQAHRIAARARHLPLDRVDELIDDNTDGRFLGVLGEPGVNVLELNLALDQEAPAR